MFEEKSCPCGGCLHCMLLFVCRRLAGRVRWECQVTLSSSCTVDPHAGTLERGWGLATFLLLPVSRSSLVLGWFQLPLVVPAEGSMINGRLPGTEPRPELVMPMLCPSSLNLTQSRCLCCCSSEPSAESAPGSASS